MNSAFHSLGRWVAAHPRAVVATWLLVIALGGWGEHLFPAATVGGAGGITGSPAWSAGQVLRTEFANPFIDPLIVAVSAPQHDVRSKPYLDWVLRAQHLLAALPEVRKVESFASAKDAKLRSADGHVTMLVVGLVSNDNEAQQKSVATVRNALAALREELRALDPAAQVAVTGGPAADYDVNAFSATGGDHAEKRALPLTLLILMVAFGTFVAACLPFLMGLATTTVALGLAFVLANLVPVSNLLSNVVTMVGLAIGIDYSLLMVTHFREHAPQASIAQTVAGTVALAGQTIAWSGMTVMAGFLGLLFSPILETRCAGIGGALVVFVSVLAALTLLPASLVLLGPVLERWPVMPRRLRRFDSSHLWLRLGAWIVKHPLLTLVVSSAGVLAFAAPLLQANSGVTNERWFLPKATEARQGAEILKAVRNDNASIPIYTIVSARDGAPVLASAHLQALVDYAAALRKDPRVASVDSAVTLRAGLGVAEYTELYRNYDEAMTRFPAVGELYVSKDRRAALFEITPANGLAVKDIERLTRDVSGIVLKGPFTVQIGGTPAEHNDFNEYMFRSLPRIFAFVVGTTLILLFIAFRSFLLPIKAVITNLLAVAAGIGAVIAVFQFGWLNGLVGLERPFTAIPLEVPMMVFCLSFGLSMDYELFLLFRIQREYARDGDNNRATVAGLAAVAPVITGAGLIMAVVFGAFVGADLPVLKMMGVGLCVAVLVDATVIRAFVVPAAMALAGRWNWYPGRRRIDQPPP
jgi:putative drug exporter of the RND superfamily